MYHHSHEKMLSERRNNMNKNSLFPLLKSSCGCVFEELELSKYSTFKIGGKARFAAFPKGEKELSALIRVSKENGLRYFVVGNASNILFESGGVDALIIFTHKLCEVEVKDEKIRCGSGFSLISLAIAAAKSSLSGLEFAYGIPGTVGGAVYMNAGAYGGEISQILVSSTCLDPETGKLVTLSREEHGFAYRKSVFQKNELVILSSEFALSKGDKEKIQEQMRENMQKRHDKQPLSYPNAGSTFKRPEGFFAGKLIEDAGLKGLRIGGASVSEKHAGFVINDGGATSGDVIALTDKIKETVYERFGVTLELEIIYIK